MKTYVYKSVIGLVLTMLCGFNLHAQEYEYTPLVKPGLQIWTTIATTEGYQHYNRFALTEEDTIMEGENYKKLYWFTDSVFNPLTSECIGGLRENNQKQVFYKGKNGYGGETWTNGMICNFSLSIGDTFALAPLNDYYVKVLAVDTVEVNNIPRRIISIGGIHGGYEVFEFIEGIGNNLGLLFDNIMAFITGGGNGLLLCYEHNGELQYMAEDITGCNNPFVGLSDVLTTDNAVTIVPNPAGAEVRISSDAIIHSVEVFNALGQKVYRTEVKAKEKTLDVHSLSKGVYIIGVNTDQGTVRKKLVKK